MTSILGLSTFSHLFETIGLSTTPSRIIKMRFLSAQHQSFPDLDVEDLSQVSQTVVKVISKEREIVHKNF